MFNNKKIKEFKGQMIRLNWLAKGELNSMTGTITASTKIHIVFNVNNNNTEIPIKYEQVESIEKLQRTGKRSGTKL